MKSLCSRIPPWPVNSLRLSSGDELWVTPFGAQALAWRTGDGVERLYISSLAGLDPQAPIRGGIPLCWPQFDRLGDMPMHGFVRQAIWRPVEVGHVPQDWLACRKTEWAVAGFELDSHLDASQSLWHDMDFTLRVWHRLEPGRLTTRLQVGNPGPADLQFTCGLHNYLACSRVLAPALHWRTEEGGETIQSIQLPEDRAIWKIVEARQVEVENRAAHRTVTLGQSGFDEQVIWNPGSSMHRRQRGLPVLPDIPDGDHLQFLCVEPAIRAKPVKLAAHMEWTGEQILEARQPL